MKFLTPELAEISGIHAGDGYLRNDGKRREWDISGSIDEKGYYDGHVIPLFNSVFNLNIKGRYFRHRNTYGFVIRKKEVIEFAHDVLGFPYGKKSLKVKIPEYILNNLTLIKPFLRGYFDTNGCFGCFKKSGMYIEFKKKYHAYPRITFSTVSKNLSNDLKKVFLHIDLKYYFREYKPKLITENLKYIFEINGIKRVEKLIRLINPKNPTKTSRFEIWRKYGFCPTKISYKERLKILKGKINPYSYYNKDL